MAVPHPAEQAERRTAEGLGAQHHDRAGEFPLHHVFCLVGTDAADYDAALGLSAKVVGPQSDGLVQIDNAYVPNTPRAFVHRGHSGRYGVVNSEEGYQTFADS